MKKKIIVAGLIILSLAGCNRFKKGEGDMLYKIVEDKSGEAIKDGEVVELSITAKTEEDAVVWCSCDYDRPALVKKEKSMFKGDLFAALGLLSRGDSAVVKINLDSMEMKMGQPRPEFTKGKYLIYALRIDNVIPKGGMKDSLYAIKVDKFLEARLERLKIQEPVKIRNYIAARHLDHVTGSGLNYTITQKGSGPVPVPGDTMEVKYTGMLMSGKVFDSTYPDIAKKAGVFHDLSNPVKITYGMYGTTRGFNEAVMLMPEGAKMKVIIPSVLAYGKQGQSEDLHIQGYTPLVYEIEMLSIIHPHKKLTENTMPDFQLYGPDEMPFRKINVEKGKKSVFVLFDAGCDHCQNEVISIGKHYSYFKNVNLYLVSANNKTEITGFMNTYGKSLSNKKNVTLLQDRDMLFITQFLPKFQTPKYPALYVYSEKEELIKYFGGQTDISQLIKAIK